MSDYERKEPISFGASVQEDSSATCKKPCRTCDGQAAMHNGTCLFKEPSALDGEPEQFQKPRLNRPTAAA